ncbi:MAG: hypothetical protein IK130_06865 [Oscillospiraceae bacterium]|nr:hypothetical protein [Oscillospiraceae bacterium]
MELRLKCKACKDYHDFDRRIPEGYAGWCYDNMEWLDPAEPLPSLTQDEYWQRSETRPQIGETWKLCVTRPFHEQTGNTFYVVYESAYQFFNGYEKAEEVDSSAIVQCRFERVFETDEITAWIEVTILDVIPFRELASRFPAYETCEPLGSFYSEPCRDTDLNAPPWKLIYFSTAGEYGSYKTIFTDENGVKHLVLHSTFCGWSENTYFGNIIQKS